MRTRGLLAVFLTLLVSMAMVPAVQADTISPASFSSTIPAVSGTTTVHKTVTITRGVPTTALVDVFFLTDTTGSMGTVITAVRNAATAILTSTATLGNVQWAVGEYKDITDTGFANPFRLNQALTASTALVQAAINTWSASGGGDTPEGNLPALRQVATDTPWRAGSTRILVQFGDAPGHDPRFGATEANTIAALNASNVRVQAVSTATGPGLDSACSGATCTAGQATRIATATGGSVQTAPGSIDAAAISTLIANAVAATFNNYSSVCLSPSGHAPNIGVASAPPCINGAFDRSLDRLFDFDVTFTGLVAGTHDFVINATVDGGIVATESDRITVGTTPAVPEPSTMILVGSGLIGVAVAVRRKLSKQVV